MATRRKPVKSHEGDGARAFGVLVEEMRGHFKAFGEKLQGVDHRVHDLDQRVAGLDQRVTEGFALIDSRFSKVDDQLNDIRYEVGQVKSAVLEHGRLLKQKVDRSEVVAIVEGVLARKGR